MITLKMNLELQQAEVLISLLKEGIEKQTAEIEAIKAELIPMEKNLEATKSQLKQLEDQLNDTKQNLLLDYDKDSSLIHKVRYVLSKSDSTLSVKDIASRLVELEPGIQGEKSDQVFKTTIAASLGNYAKDGQLFYKDDKDGVNKYGLLNDQ